MKVFVYSFFLIYMQVTGLKNIAKYICINAIFGCLEISQ